MRNIILTIATLLAVVIYSCNSSSNGSSENPTNQSQVITVFLGGQLNVVVQDMDSLHLGNIMNPIDINQAVPFCAPSGDTALALVPIGTTPFTINQATWGIYDTLYAQDTVFTRYWFYPTTGFPCTQMW